MDCAVLTHVSNIHSSSTVEHDVHVRTIVRNKSEISVGEREREHVLADVTQLDCDVRDVS